VIGTDGLCPDSLVTRARAGTLSSAERRQLDAHLAQCESCRLTLQLGYDFDQVLSEQPGDELLSARVAAAAMRAPRSGRGRSLAVAAALLLLITASAVAAGPTLWRKWKAWRAPSPAQMVLADPPTPVLAPAVEPEPESVPEPEQAVVPAPASPVHAHRPRPSAPEHVAAAPSADELFASANARRRAGDVGAARTLYVDLQQKYPTSVPATVSRVSLGRLFLDRLHDPASALSQFDGYLAQTAHATLAEEALFGRATALMRLGRREEERATWQRLMLRFPASVYAERAASRLGPTR